MRPSAAEPDELGVVGKPIQTECRDPASRLCACWLSLVASAVEEEPEEQAANRGRGDDRDDETPGEHGAYWPFHPFSLCLVAAPGSDHTPPGDRLESVALTVRSLLPGWSPEPVRGA